MENAAFGKRGRVCYTGRMMKRFLWICALCALTAALCACALAEETPLESLLYNAGASEIYVAPWGDDDDAGTLEEPLQTLGEALLRARGGAFLMCCATASGPSMNTAAERNSAG